MINASVRRLFAVSAVILSLGVTAQAKFMDWGPWELKDKPPLSLAQALPLAQTSLGKDANSLWCSKAFVMKTGFTPSSGHTIGKTVITGQWVLTFSNGKGECFTVTVSADGKTRVRKPSDDVEY